MPFLESKRRIYYAKIYTALQHEGKNRKTNDSATSHFHSILISFVFCKRLQVLRLHLD